MGNTSVHFPTTPNKNANYVSSEYYLKMIFHSIDLNTSVLGIRLVCRFLGNQFCSTSYEAPCL